MSTNTRNTLIGCCALSFSLGVVHGQERNSHVFIGRNHLTFEALQPLPGTAAINIAGLASISDSTGELKALLGKNPTTLLYGIYDGSINPIAGTPNGFSVNDAGWPRAIFLPKPGSEDSVHLAFINRYTTVPPHMFRLGLLTLDAGGIGEPAGSIHPNVHWIATDVACGFMVVPHANESDYWIVVQPIGGNAFHAYQVAATGAQPVPVVSNAGPIRSVEWQYGQWTPNTEGTMFGYSQRNSGSGGGTQADTLLSELFGFDILTGAVQHLLTLPSKRAQGFEFSASGRYFYVLEHAPNWGASGATVTLVQYDLEHDDPASSRSVVHEYAEPNLANMSVRVQLLRGKDGRIYRTHEQSTTMVGVIMQPEEPAPLCAYVHDALSVPLQALSFSPPLKRYHDSPAIITAAPSITGENGAVTSPNPIADSGWLVQTGLEGIVRLEWHDGLGRAVRSEVTVVSDGRVAIDASALAPGSYVLRVMGRGAPPLIQRVVVAR